MIREVSPTGVSEITLAHVGEKIKVDTPCVVELKRVGKGRGRTVATVVVEPVHVICEVVDGEAQDS